MVLESSSVPVNQSDICLSSDKYSNSIIGIRFAFNVLFSRCKGVTIKAGRYCDDDDEEDQLSVVLF